MLGVIAVDFGGTHIRAAYFASGEPPFQAHEKIATEAQEGPEAVIGRLVAAIQAVTPPHTEDLRIGIAAPGPLDHRAGLVLKAPNLPGWTNIPLRDRIAKRIGFPVALGNDANMAALGEWRYGAGRGTQNVLYMTISTGIGGGVISEGRLLLGKAGLATELGHMQVAQDGPVCGCGQRGHIEAIAAGPAIAERARERLRAGEPSSLASLPLTAEGVTAVEVGSAARAGDPLAVSVIREAGEAIGGHLASLVHAFNPEVIILGGGVSQLGAVIFEPLEAALRAHIMHPAYLDGLRLVPAALGDDAGLIGAMVLARES
jgi:glucokinase